MKGAKKHFSRALTLLLSVLIMLQTVTVPAFAAENATENVEVATDDASTEEESTFNLINADVQIDDEYGNETDYISEVQIPDLEQISEETLVENGVSIHSDYPGDAMVYLTQRWLNQEYGNVPGFGYVTEDGRTGWDTVTVLRELCRWNLESQIWQIILAQLQSAFIARICCGARMVSQIGNLQYCREHFGAKGITLDIICPKPKMAPLYSMACLMQM